MKILISAIAADPFSGSESHVGWQTSNLVARSHEVWVLTHGRYRANIEKATADGLVPANMHFIYHGVPFDWLENRLFARLQSWMDYLKWSNTVLDVAADAHRKVKFDLAHHVTYSSWRVPSPLWQLGIPLVWGPVGGAGSMPFRFYPTVSLSGKAFEGTRFLLKAGAMSPKLRRCVRNATFALASNQETKALLVRMRGSEEGVRTLSPAFFTEGTISRFQMPAGVSKPGGLLRIFAGGYMIGSKGVAIALQGLALAKRSGVRFTYTVAGRGPETPHLEKTAARLGIADDVRFVESLSGDAYPGALRESHVYLLPSFRENIGLTMVEAMLARCVPIVANISAPGEIVTDDCGFRIPVRDPDQMAADIARVICTLDSDRSLTDQLGYRAFDQISGGFGAESYAEKINAIYAEAVARR